MTDIRITPASWGDAWWAAGQDFALLPPVDPDFAALSPARRILLRLLVLPLSYRKRPSRWTARAQERRIGYLYARPQGRVLMLDSLGVLPEHRRRGAGRALVARAARQAQEEGLTFLGGSLASANRTARQFFSALGFRPLRTRRWLLEDPAALPAPKEAWRVEELSAPETLPAYERWQDHAVRSGIAWAAEALLTRPLSRRDWAGYARHWGCFRGGSQRGYLRIAGLRGEYRAYLACRVADLKDAAAAAWLAQALRSYQAEFRSLRLDLPTEAHIQAGRRAFEASGLRLEPRPRLLLLRPL